VGKPLSVPARFQTQSNLAGMPIPTIEPSDNPTIVQSDTSTIWQSNHRPIEQSPFTLSHLHTFTPLFFLLLFLFRRRADDFFHHVRHLRDQLVEPKPNIPLAMRGGTKGGAIGVEKNPTLFLLFPFLLRRIHNLLYHIRHLSDQLVEHFRFGAMDGDFVLVDHDERGGGDAEPSSSASG